MIYLGTKPTSCLPCLHQIPDGHFRPHIETRLDEVTQPSIDVQAFTGSKRYLACDILSIFDGQNGRGKKWRVALPPVGVAGKDPSPEVYKDLFIHCTGPCPEASAEDGLDPQTQGNEEKSRETHRPREAGMHESIEERSNSHVKWGACEDSFCGRSRIHQDKKTPPDPR